MDKLDITRRDFVGGTMLGAGAILLDMVAPGTLRAAETIPPAFNTLLGQECTKRGRTEYLKFGSTPFLTASQHEPTRQLS